MSAPVSKCQQALALADELEELTALIPPRYQDAGSYERGLAAVIRHVQAAGGRLDDVGTGSAIRLCGYRATSEMGPLAACSNWIRQVRAKCAPAAQ